MLSSSFVFLTLASLASARSILWDRRIPKRRGWHVHERRDDAPTGFTYTGPAQPDQVIQFRIALTQNNPNGLIQALYNVSDPDHPQYGQHLSQDDVSQYFAPTSESATAVRGFLEAHGLNVSQLSPAGDWLGFNTTVSQANNMFNAEYSLFRHLDSGSESMNTLSYAVPAALKPHLSYVHPGISFFRPAVRDLTPRVANKKRHKKNMGMKTRDDQCTDKPACFQSLYGLPGDMASRYPKNGILVTGGGDPASHSDLANFLKQFRPDLSALNPAYDFIDQSIDGGVNDQSKPAGGEENLDIQWTMGLANGIPVQYAALGDQVSDSGNNWIDLANTLHGLNDSVLPKVMTTSYVYNETDVGDQFLQGLCNAYAALGARGVSIMFASGDFGPGSNQDCTKLSPGFPATCPFVTTVGGTTGANPEVGIDYSGGGWSNVFPVPDYQKDVVQSYVNGLSGNNTQLFNASGRAYPDVAAQAGGVSFVMQGQVKSVGGTSLASPIFAATIALLNDQLYAAGKAPLGFLNPWLYKNAGMLNDIKDGFMTDDMCGKGIGFKAGSGWDPVTGLGTPNFENMLKATSLWTSTQSGVPAILP